MCGREEPAGHTTGRPATVLPYCALGEDPRKIGQERGVEELRRDILNGAADVPRDQAEEPCDGWRKAPDAEARIEKYRGYVGARQQVLEIVVGSFQLRESARKVGVGHDEFSV